VRSGHCFYSWDGSARAFWVSYLLWWEKQEDFEGILPFEYRHFRFLVKRERIHMIKGSNFSAPEWVKYEELCKKVAAANGEVLSLRFELTST
jgi:hypothetical protein